MVRVQNITTRLLIPFQLFGFLLVVVPARNKRLEFVLLLLACLNACIVATLAWSCYFYAEYMFDFSNKIGLIVDVTQIVAPIVAHLIVILEALYNRKTIRRLWMEIFEIMELGGEALQSILAKVYVRFVAKAIVLHVIATALEVRILTGIVSSWFRSRVTAEWSFIGCRSLYIFYFLHVDIIGGILESVASDLQAVSRASISQLKSKSVEMDTRELLGRVEFNRSVFNKAYSVVQRLNVCFGWSLISNLINNFLAITIAFYWNYRGVYIERLTTESVLCSPPLIMGVLFTIYACEESLKPLQRIKYYLHRIDRDKRNRNLHNSVVNFSSQLLNEKLSFNTNGFFDINFDFLKGICASITVYLVIFVQFMPDDKGNVMEKRANGTEIVNSKD